MQLNDVARLLLHRLKENPEDSGLQMLESICAEIRHPDPAVVIAGGTRLLNEFRDKQIIMGTIK